MSTAVWLPPQHLDRSELIKVSDELLADSGMEIRVENDVLTVDSLDLDWEIATTVVEPADPARIAIAPDGRKVGLLLLHGGLGDHREKIPMARFLASHFGYRVSLMSYPGRYYLLDPDGDWPGDTINADGTVRTPIWHRKDLISPEEYEVIRDRSDPAKRAKWGTLTFAAAIPGTRFHDRMAAWPAAFEASIVALCRRDFPAADFSVYLHGHSTGGPFAHMALQRVENAAGLLGAETSSYPYIFRAGIGLEWTHPFNYLAIMSWRNLAMYAGPEAGPDLQWKLPWVMEEVLEHWEESKTKPFFKAEYIFNYAAEKQLTDAARAVAARLKLGIAAEEELVSKYVGYTRPLPSPSAPPVPPLLLGIVEGSRDHTPERYENVVLPSLQAISPAPRVALTRYGAGVHAYDKPLPELAFGALPAIAKTWDDAIMNGFFLQN